MGLSLSGPLRRHPTVIPPPETCSKHTMSSITTSTGTALVMACLVGAAFGAPTKAVAELAELAAGADTDATCLSRCLNATSHGAGHGCNCACFCTTCNAKCGDGCYDKCSGKHGGCTSCSSLGPNPHPDPATPCSRSSAGTGTRHELCTHAWSTPHAPFRARGCGCVCGLAPPPGPCAGCRGPTHRPGITRFDCGMCHFACGKTSVSLLILPGSSRMLTALPPRALCSGARG